MRLKIDRKYINMGITAFFVIIASIAVCYVMFNFSSFSKGFRGFLKIMVPIFNGFLITYLFSPLLDFFDGRIPKLLEKIKLKLSKKTVRNIAIFCTMFCIILAVYLFISILVPQLISSINSIAGSFPTYYNNLMDTADKVFSDYPEIESYLNQNSNDIGLWISENVLPQAKSLLTHVSTGIASGISSGFSFVWNLLLGMILSCYIMGMREHFYGQMKKIFNAVFTQEKVKSLEELFHDINRTFQEYIKSSLIDSIIIGGICFVLCVFMNLPYPVLISVIVGVTNIIPFFGPYLGAIPSAIIILLISPIKALYFLIMILVLQQCDGNIIKPKLFGDSTGLSGFWVIFSILVGGGFFGALGMYLGVPTFAVIYSLIKRKVNSKLTEKGLPTEVEKYMGLK